jgi:D-amino peptidase
MKVYISADIEGVTNVTSRDETEHGKPGHEPAREQMTAEVAAACEGALAAGVDEIWVKDAHDRANNLIPSRLPKPVRLIRGWSGHPLSMMQELDGSFDGAMMIGYHARAGAGASPLEHTFTGRVGEIRVNDRPFSEFAFAAYAAAYYEVPVALISGDEGICAEATALCPGISAVPVKRGIGSSTNSIHPDAACERIQQAAETALKGDLSSCAISLPNRFSIDVVFRRHGDAYAGSFYPGAALTNPSTVRFETDDYFEALRALSFILRG